MARKKKPAQQKQKTAPERKRLDVRCVELGLATSREQAQALILAGEIFVNGERADKAGSAVADHAEVSHQGAGTRYVSRGGLKLEGALADLAVDPAGQVILDVGASTGGFTDCMLQHGARHVLALDVGFGQLDWTLRNHAQVTVIERTNVRHVDPAELAQRVTDPTLWPPQLATIDVSFISLTLVLPVVARILGPKRPILALVKPQFEAGRGQVGKGGVVRDDTVRRAAIDRVRQFADERGFSILNAADAAIRGPKGNLEHWLLLETPAV